MSDYNLQGLNPRDFQHLVQAIARKQIGAGVTAYGDGKDGGRDLTFTGKMNYPSSTAAWDGYLVLGCKFCQRPIGDSKRDGDWALEQLEGDLKKFLNRKRDLPRPEYYLFATNISLTGVAEKGSRDRASGLLQKFATKLPLKGHGVWDYNDFRGFLDGDQNLRLAYGHLVTAGDVLRRMLEHYPPQPVRLSDLSNFFRGFSSLHEGWFSDHAAHAVQAAIECAKKSGLGEFTTQHLFLGLLSSESGITGRAVRFFSRDPFALEAKLMRRIGVGEKIFTGIVKPSDAVKRIFARLWSSRIQDKGLIIDEIAILEAIIADEESRTVQSILKFLSTDRLCLLHCIAELGHSDGVQTDTSSGQLI
ncbi:MAG: hypothetical protein V2B20_06280 [Pseudomonadota bacterium]